MERSFRKHGFGLFGDHFRFKCLFDVVVQPISLLEVARNREVIQAWREVGASVASGSSIVSKRFQLPNGTK